jgi:hypothetical protein
LQQQFDQVSANFDNARQQLLERVAICSSEEFLALSEEVEHACDLLDVARAALDSHLEQHRCTRKRSRNGGDAANPADGK